MWLSPHPDRFIKTLMQQGTACHPQVTCVGQQDREDTSVEEHGVTDVPDSPQVTSLKECMLRIWQELSNNPEITRMVESVAGENPLQVLAEVSEHVFATGINWGRIVVFFYFAFRVIAQSSPEWFKLVINWALTFLRNRLVAWIQEQGGWVAMLSYSLSSSRSIEND
uniref:Bcl-2 Bcl-2 homology region 1-3 domain-containing protein n=1 Tax=Salvator merianae TaxID=96440 RepID=A0A8D0B9E6_SALMN